MEWAFWVVIAIVVVIAAGTFWMRNQPLRDARGNVVDELGRPVDSLSSDANVVLITLWRSGEPLTGYDLRRHVTMSRQDFYAMIADLEYRQLVSSKIGVVGAHNVRLYLLTDRGRELFDDRAA